MMQFESLGSITLEVLPRQQWLWHSASTSSFVAGDERTAYSISQDDIGCVTQLTAARPFDPAASFHHPCNLPIPDDLYDEFRHEGWRGFQFLSVNEYDLAVDLEGHPVGNLLATIVFGPNYGHYVLHDPSGLVLGLRSGSMQLLRIGEAGFSTIDESRTRGRAALAFCTHPGESLLVYGDNYGNFHAHQFGEDGFGKAKKIAAREQKASATQFVDSNTLLIGGMGYLESYSFSSGKFSLLHAVNGPVRDFVWNAEHRVLFVNQGMHGVSVYGYSDSGFSKLGGVQASFSVNQMAVSRCGGYVAVSAQSASIETVLTVFGTRWT